MKASKRQRKKLARAIKDVKSCTVLVFSEEDQDAMTLAIKGSAMWSVLWEVDQWLRKKLKYGHEFKTADEALEACREFLGEFMADNGVSFDMVS